VQLSARSPPRSKWSVTPGRALKDRRVEAGGARPTAAYKRRCRRPAKAEYLGETVSIMLVRSNGRSPSACGSSRSTPARNGADGSNSGSIFVTSQGSLGEFHRPNQGMKCCSRARSTAAVSKPDSGRGPAMFSLTVAPGALSAPRHVWRRLRRPRPDSGMGGS
jgi:hypothetical protein